MQNPIFFGLDVFLFIISFCIAPLDGENATDVKVDVGIILDLDTYVGKISRTCMLMAIEDFYTNHNYSTRIVTHLRNSNNDDVDAASAGMLVVYSSFHLPCSKLDSNLCID